MVGGWADRVFALGEARVTSRRPSRSVRPPHRWSRSRQLATQLLALVAVGLAGVGLVDLGGASAAESLVGIGAALPSPLDLSLTGKPSLNDVDTRVGRVAPSAAQQSEAAGLGSSTRWNRYGTPQSMINYSGFLASGLTGAPVDQARTFVRNHRSLFKLSDADVTKLGVLKDTVLAGTASHVVMFRQSFGTLPAAEDGLITGGV